MDEMTYICIDTYIFMYYYKDIYSYIEIFIYINCYLYKSSRAHGGCRPISIVATVLGMRVTL